MKKSIYAVLCALLLGIVTSLYAQIENATTVKTMEITAKSDGHTIHLTVGQEFTIKLNETSGTGYRWQFVHNGAPAVTLIHDSFQPDSQKPGAQGMHEFLLKAISPGNVTIDVQLLRPWDPKSVTRSLSFHLVVT